MDRIQLYEQIKHALAPRYQLMTEIGRGGNARIYGALDEEGRRLAIKVLHPELAQSVAAKRFLREIAFAQKLSHHRLVPVLDSGDIKKFLYYVMPFIAGYNVREYLEREKRLEVGFAVSVACDVLDGLEYAHEQGIAHRDVKPENILVAPEGGVLVDLGIARAIAVAGKDRITKSGFVVGTDLYMSPEQTDDTLEIDGRTDLYSLGVVVYEMLAGVPPFQQGGSDDVMEAHRTTPPPDLRKHREDVSAELWAALSQALAKSRAERWQRAADMRASLLDFAS